MTFDINVWLHRGCMVNVVVSRLRVMMIIGVDRDGNGAGWDQSKGAHLCFSPSGVELGIFVQESQGKTILLICDSRKMQTTTYYIHTYMFTCTS